METRIKELRKLRGMKQADVANKLGVSQAQFARLEQGNCDISLTQIKKLADIFKVKTYEILPAEDQPEELSPEEKQFLELLRKSKSQSDNNNESKAG